MALTRWHTRSAYQSLSRHPEDLKLIPELKKLAPDEFTGFVALDAIVGKEGGAFIAAVLRAGAAVTHGTLGLKLFDRE